MSENSAVFGLTDEQLRTIIKEHKDMTMAFNQLINHRNYRIRKEVATTYFGAEKLLHDTSNEVRVRAAENILHPESYIDHKDPDVRTTLARRGAGHETLRHDPVETVRHAVVSTFKGDLKEFITDPSPLVRKAVAYRGQYLDELLKDRDPEVVSAARFARRNPDIAK